MAKVIPEVEMKLLYNNRMKGYVHVHGNVVSGFIVGSDTSSVQVYVPEDDKIVELKIGYGVTPDWLVEGFSSHSVLSEESNFLDGEEAQCQRMALICSDEGVVTGMEGSTREYLNSVKALKILKGLEGEYFFGGLIDDAGYVHAENLFAWFDLGGKRFLIMPDSLANQTAPMLGKGVRVNLIAEERTIKDKRYHEVIYFG